MSIGIGELGSRKFNIPSFKSQLTQEQTRNLSNHIDLHTDASNTFDKCVTFDLIFLAWLFVSSLVFKAYITSIGYNQHWY